MSERNWFNIGLVGILGGLVGYCGGTAHKRSNFIPKENEVQAGYVVPNKLEIKLEDLDQNGEKETIMRYDGKAYLLRLDSDGKPTVDAYEMGSAEVVPLTK